ncbi:acyltransferase family protein [Mycolicibacterium vaccae]|uniref:acyltransferase family protein n=1 Tax=Mycolicibacterium vaccae TaxID=1810 RepID=UPI003D08FEBE
MGWRSAAAVPLRRIDRLAAATPDSRDRVVDAARALCIVVVILWHWTLSVTYRTPDGNLVMANPIHAVPGAWVATWVLQVMPLFFVIGGYANLAAFERARSTGTPSLRFVGDRLRRLLYPTGAWAAVWLAGEGVAAALPGEHRWIWQWFPGYLVPLWFLVVYGAVIALVPLTAAWHARAGGVTLAALATLIVAGTVADRAFDVAAAAWVTAALVWLFCHQLGYAWRGWNLGGRSWPVRAAVAGAGLAAVTALSFGAGLPRSMVATVGTSESNMFPTTAAIAALAVFQLGLVLMLTPTARRVLRRPRWWRPVVAVNAVAMTVFVWHMTAYLVVLWLYERAGATLPAEPTAQWWAQRWLWLVAPAAVLAVLTTVFAPVEFASRRGRSRAA